MDFGTRRRFSREVQQAIVKRLQQEPWFVGTSNYDLARRLDLTPMGTQAHEWFQAHQQISRTWQTASVPHWPRGWKNIPINWASRLPTVLRWTRSCVILALNLPNVIRDYAMIPGIR